MVALGASPSVRRSILIGVPMATTFGRVERTIRIRACLLAIAAFCLPGVRSDVMAHPSDPATLTLDLLMSVDGLTHLDAAMQKETYEARPSEAVRHEVATRILAALGIPAQRAVIDAATSERYHEVGFTVSLSAPFVTEGASLALDTEPLQDIAAVHGERLKLAICIGDSDTISQRLDVASDRPGREPEDQERPGCRLWDFAEDAEAMHIVAAVVPASAPPQSVEAPSDKREEPSVVSVLAAGCLIVVSGALLNRVRQKQRR